MPNPSLSGPSAPPASGPARQLVILLHGWGADGANLIDLADSFAAVLPGAQFIAPNAPETCEANPFGFQWFSLMNRDPHALLSGVRHAADVLNPFIDAQLSALGLDESQLALVGFSQGTMLALHVGLRRKTPPACIVGFSGALLGGDRLSAEITCRPPVCLIHGAGDTVVPYAAMANAETILKPSGVPVQTHTRPGLGHGIDLEGIAIAGRFLGENLG